ncbi:hypothetical protein K435DRAFT_657502, partial [Dendrothele bispora CBS 962.96]
PRTLVNWRKLEILESEALWHSFLPIFEGAGLQLWPHVRNGVFKAPKVTCPEQNGLIYSGPKRESLASFEPGTPGSRKIFCHPLPLSRIARTRDGTDVLIRAITVHGGGYDHLLILRQLSRSPNSLLSQNHALHMLDEIESPSVPVTFGIFPLVGSSLSDAVNPSLWPKNSLGDVMEMFLQALEALRYIHTQRIAHRDAFVDNFLVQWQPESLLMQRVSHSRPRVYLTDFETAIQFSEAEEAVCHWLPVGESIEYDSYGRPCPEDVLSGSGYDPFSLDVWQFFTGLEQLGFKCSNPEISEVLATFHPSDPTRRVSAEEAYNALASLIDNVPPVSLLVDPNRSLDD